MNLPAKRYTEEDIDAQRARHQALLQHFQPAIDAAWVARQHAHRSRLRAAERDEAMRAAFLAECDRLSLGNPPARCVVLGVPLDG